MRGRRRRRDGVARRATPSARWSAGGGYATHAASRRRRSACRCRPALDLVAAAAMPETFFTVWTNVFERGGSAGGGDGALSRRHERHRHHGDSAGGGARRAGAGHGGVGREVPRRAWRLAPSTPSTTVRPTSSPPCSAQTGGRGVDLVLDIMGGSYVPRNLAALALDGRLVQIGLMEGRADRDGRSPPRPRAPSHAHRARRCGARRSRRRGGSPPRSLARSGRSSRPAACKPLVAATFPLADAAAAHRLMESSAHVGKIVLVP